MYYVYEHWRPDKNIPFYVGKGRRKRCYLMSCRSKWHRAIQAKLEKMNLGVVVKIIAECEDEKSAFELEIARILDLREQGFEIVNLTSGGQGSSGHVFSEERRAKISAKKRGNKHFLGKSHSSKVKNALSARMKGNFLAKGRVMSEEHKLKISIALRGNKNGLGTVMSSEARAKISAHRKRAGI